jgi:hypothetical protein
MASRSMRAVETGTGAAPTAPASLRPVDAGLTPGPPDPAAAAGLAPAPPPGGPVGAAGVGVLGGASGMGGGGGLAGVAPDGAPPPIAPPPPEDPAPPPIPPPLAPPDPPAGAWVLAAGSVGMAGGVTGCSGVAAEGVNGCCAAGTDLVVASMALAAGRAPVFGPCWVSLPPAPALVSCDAAALVDWVLGEEDAPLLAPLVLPPGLPPPPPLTTGAEAAGGCPLVGEAEEALPDGVDTAGAAGLAVAAGAGLSAAGISARTLLAFAIGCADSTAGDRTDPPVAPLLLLTAGAGPCAVFCVWSRSPVSKLPARGADGGAGLSAPPRIPAMFGAVERSPSSVFGPRSDAAVA